jgi:glycosyltransferase involved in cell wall biosynthesis
MKKHCFILGTPLNRDAISSHFQALGDELVRRGHETFIIAPPGECYPDGQKAGFRHLSWPSDRPTRLRDARLLWGLIRKHKPDCLIANFAPVNWMCVIGWLTGVQCRIAWYHTLSRQIDLSMKLPPRRIRFLRLRKRLVYAKATHLATNSRAALEDAHLTYGVPREKCKVWRNSLADPALWLQLKPAADREDLVVCAGRFDRTKGQDALIDAIFLCATRLKATKIEFLGAGPLLEPMRERAAQKGLEGHCVFRGVVPHEEVLSRMARAKLTVVPSRNEAFGLVNIESMAVGTPVIASNVDGIPEIVRDKVDGLLCPPEDPKALAEKLMGLLHNPGLRQEMGQNCRQRFMAVYEQSKVVAEQADWLESITAAGTAR